VHPAIRPGRIDKEAPRLHMKTSACLCSLFSALAMMASTPAFANKPLRMDLRPFVAPSAAANPAAARPAANKRSFNAPHAVRGDDIRPMPRTPRVDPMALGMGLVTGLDPADATVANSPASGYPVLQFQKRGHLARDIKRGYRNMGENLAKRVWEDPKGKRIVFDIEGRPGVGVEIPLR
jgi:hypothetical protein